MIKKVIKTILNRLGIRRKYNKPEIIVEPRKRQTPDQFEQKNIDAFRQDILALPPIKSKDNGNQAEWKWIDRQQ